VDEELSVLVAPVLLSVAELLSVVAVLVVAECNFGVAVWEQLAPAVAEAVADQLAVGVTGPVAAIDVDVPPSYVVATAVAIESSYRGCG
jgi:hypothetical protein